MTYDLALRTGDTLQYAGSIPAQTPVPGIGDAVVISRGEFAHRFTVTDRALVLYTDVDGFYLAGVRPTWRLEVAEV